MIIKAKYESECTLCEQLIREGEKIDWEPGESSASHVKCPEGALEKKCARDRFVSIGNSISRTGEMPPGRNIPKGERAIFVRIHSRYYWCYIGAKWIWYIQSNSHSGDNWDSSNVRGNEGPGIGWRVPYNEELAREIRDIANILNS